MSDRCEPPPELRGQDGWHWIETPDGDATLGLWGRGLQCWAVVGATELWFSKPLEIGNWHYLAPVTPPDVVARLRVDLARLVEAAHIVSREFYQQHPLILELSAALAAMKETGG